MVHSAGLFNHLFQLSAEHVHLSAHQIATQRDACRVALARRGKRVSLLACDREFVRLNNGRYSATGGLLVHDLDLLVDHLTGEAIDCHVHPVMLLSLNNEVILKAARIGLKAA